MQDYKEGRQTKDVTSRGCGGGGGMSDLYRISKILSIKTALLSDVKLNMNKKNRNVCH